MGQELHYYPGVFEVRDERAAQAIILTDEGPGADTSTRWDKETPYVADLIAEQLRPKAGQVLLDYGCGLGRLAKPLIEQFGCHVIGVDISAAMRNLAPQYVRDERFSIVSPAHFDALTASGLRVDGAFCVWVLQHCLQPADDARRIRAGLKTAAPLFVLNMKRRAIPAVEPVQNGYQFHWVVDGCDVDAVLREAFRVEAEGEIEPGAIPNSADAGSFWMRCATT